MTTIDDDELYAYVEAQLEESGTWDDSACVLDEWGKHIARLAAEYESDEPEPTEFTIHLGAPYSKLGAKCIYCGQPGTRILSGLPGSIITPSGEKHSFKALHQDVYVCDEHGILKREGKVHE